MDDILEEEIAEEESEDYLDEDDKNIIEEEMNSAMEEFKQELEEAIKNDTESQKEIDELLSTDDVNERIEIWKKYHPNEEFRMFY